MHGARRRDPGRPPPRARRQRAGRRPPSWSAAVASLSLIAPDTPTGSGLPVRAAAATPPTPTSSPTGSASARSSRRPRSASDWLNLFPRGDALTQEAFGVTRAGQPAAYGGVETDLSGYQRRATSLTHADGSLPPRRRRPAAAERVRRVVYDVGGSPAADARRRPARRTLAASRTPTSGPPTLPAADPAPEMCAVLHPAADGEAAGSRSPHAHRRRVRRGTSAQGRHDVEVQPAGGAYVQSGADDAATDGTPYVIDSAAYKYELIGPEVARLHRLRRQRRAGGAQHVDGLLQRTRSSCRSTWHDGCRRTPRRTAPPRSHGRRTRRGWWPPVSPRARARHAGLRGAAVGVRRRRTRCARRPTLPETEVAGRHQGRDQPAAGAHARAAGAGGHRRRAA